MTVGALHSHEDSQEADVPAVDDVHDGVAGDLLQAELSRARDRLVAVGDLETIRAVVDDEGCKRLTAGA